MYSRVALIDFSEVLYKYFYGYKDTFSKSGHCTSCILGVSVFCINMLQNKIIPGYNFDRVVFAGDSTKSWRKKLLSSYKAQRPPCPDDLVCQIPIVENVIQAFGYDLIRCPSYEGDDVIATYISQSSRDNKDILFTIFSSDKDVIQLLSSSTNIYHLRRNAIIDVQEAIKEYNIHPSCMPYYQALIGDNADNISGVKGIGPKTAVSIISQYDNLDMLKKNITNIKPQKLQEKLIAHKDQLDIFFSLVSLCCDAPITIPYHASTIDSETLYSIFDSYDIHLKSKLQNILSELCNFDFL